MSSPFERLKKKIHETKYPLGPVGRNIMGVVYFSVPIIFAISIFEPIQQLARRNWFETFLSSFLIKKILAYFSY